MTYRYRIALIFIAGFFIDCVNIFISTVSLPAIAQQLALSPASVVWVSNSYILGLTLIIPLGPWLAARFGARATLVASMLLFSAAALLAGLADRFLTLTLFRFIQGVGGGLLIPVGQALAFSLFPAQERARLSTLIMSVALIAPAISPALGGVLVDHYSWRWVLLAPLPFSLATALLAGLWVKSAAPQAKKPDWQGLLLVSLTLTLLLCGLSGYADAPSKTLPTLLLLAGVLAGLCYLRYARQRSDALIDLHIVRHPRMRFSLAVYYAIPGLFTGVNVLAAFWLQQDLGWSAEESGALMLLYAAGALGAMLVSGKLWLRLGAPRLFCAALLLHAAGIALLATGASHWLPLAWLVMGIGGGIGANTAQATALTDFDGAALARASVVWNLNRQIAFSAGAALLTLIFTLARQHLPQPDAWRVTFAISAAAGLLPLFALPSFTKRICHGKP